MFQLGRVVLFALVIVAGARTWAQNDGQEALGRFDQHIHMQVHVVTANDRAVSSAMQVRLMFERDPSPLVTVSTNGEGVVDFTIPRTGNFQIEVSGPTIETTVSEPFSVTTYDRTLQQYIHVKLKGQDAESGAAKGVVSAKEMGVPKEASKEFDAGVAAMRGSDWKGAEQHFETAISKYPNFDAAYDDLGMARQNAGDLPGAKTAYQKALELNDHNADASRNLARVLEGEKNWSGAEELLTKSLGVEPNNAGSLTLLSIAQLEQGKVDEAIASASRVHGLEHKSYASAHLVLARAYEMKGRNKEAIAEYQLFISEEPNGPRSEAAKKKMEKLQAAG